MNPPCEVLPYICVFNYAALHPTEEGAHIIGSVGWCVVEVSASAPSRITPSENGVLEYEVHAGLVENPCPSAHTLAEQAVPLMDPDVARYAADERLNRCVGNILHALALEALFQKPTYLRPRSNEPADRGGDRSPERQKELWGIGDRPLVQAKCEAFLVLAPFPPKAVGRLAYELCNRSKIIAALHHSPAAGSKKEFSGVDWEKQPRPLFTTDSAMRRWQARSGGGRPAIELLSPTADLSLKRENGDWTILPPADEWRQKYDKVRGLWQCWGEPVMANCLAAKAVFLPKGFAAAIRRAVLATEARIAESRIEGVEVDTSVKKLCEDLKDLRDEERKQLSTIAQYHWQRLSVRQETRLASRPGQGPPLLDVLRGVYGESVVPTENQSG